MTHAHWEAVLAPFNSHAAFDIALQLTFIFCVCYAIIADFRALLIPNWIALSLLVAFAVFAGLHLAVGIVQGHLLTAVVILIVTIAFFVLGWIGGGDVKFMTAIALWMGPEHIFTFILLMTLLGATLAMSILFIDKYALMVTRRVQELAIVGRLMQLGQSRQCPYGVAIGIAALLASPEVFANGTVFPPS